MTSRLKVAVIGGGWAGLAAAIEARSRDAVVTLFEMAPQLGGRARAVDASGLPLDNGQHILIGAYTQTLALMKTLGVDLDAAFLRLPLRLVDAAGGGLSLPPGAALPAFARAVLRLRAWPFADRLALLAAATSWAVRGFRCDPSLTVAALTARLPASVRLGLIDPLCVAALNTPASDASASVFLRVLKDGLFAGPGSSDLLLPRSDLTELLPTPAARWLQGAGANLRLAHRVQRVEPQDVGWQVDGENFDRIILATPPREAARLTQTFAPAWSRGAAALRYEPIVTLYLQSTGTHLTEPMLALQSDETKHPAQFVFDRGQLGGPAGLLAFVVSGAQAWVDRGQEATLAATVRQAHEALGAQLKGPLQTIKVLVEKRATFRCTPGLVRPLMAIAPGLLAAGDHVDGPYPATIEGAVRSGLNAARKALPAARR